MAERMVFVDDEGEESPARVNRWRSEGEPFLPRLPAFDASAIVKEDRSVWRYERLLGLADKAGALRLGEGGTPLVETSLVGMPVYMKLEYLQPTGSYKDRGAAVLAASIAGAGSKSAVEDSSGNAGASLAAYLTAVGIPLKLFVPRWAASSIKVRQARIYGAEVDAEASTRAEAAERAQDAVSKSTIYASHVYSPYFLAGQMTLAWEIWEQLGRVPDVIVAPVGHGLLLLGLYHGFKALVDTGEAESVPRLYGVQARACAPIFEAYQRNAETVFPVAPGETEARGARVEDPPRGGQVLAAVRETGGAMLTVDEDEIRRGLALAANLGWFVEPTSALVVAGVVKLDKLIDGDETLVLPLTGTGLKI